MNEKPLSLILNDFRQELTRVVNESGLPLCITELIIKELYDEAKKMARQELMIDKKNFENTQNETTEE